MSGSYGTHCEHVIVEVMTGREVLPWVNVRAAPDEGPAMTYGRNYRCVRCRRSYKLMSPRRPSVFHCGPRLEQDWDS